MTPRTVCDVADELLEIGTRDVMLDTLIEYGFSPYRKFGVDEEGHATTLYKFYGDFLVGYGAKKDGHYEFLMMIQKRYHEQ